MTSYALHPASAIDQLVSTTIDTQHTDTIEQDIKSVAEYILGGRLATTYTPEIHTLSRVLYLVASVFGREYTLSPTNPFPSTTYGDECAHILRIIRIHKTLPLTARSLPNASSSTSRTQNIVFLTTPNFSTLFSAALGDGIITYIQSLYQHISTQVNTQSLFNIPLHSWNGELEPTNNNTHIDNVFTTSFFPIQTSLRGSTGHTVTYPLPNQTTSSYQRKIYHLATYLTHGRQYGSSVLQWLFYFWRNIAINTVAYVGNTLVKPVHTVILRLYQSFPRSIRSFLNCNLYPLFTNPENRTILTKLILDILFIRFLRYGRTVNIVQYFSGLVPFRIQNISSTILRGGETDADEQVWQKWTNHAATLLTLKVTLQLTAITVRFLYAQYQNYSSVNRHANLSPHTVTNLNRNASGSEESKQSYDEYVGRTVCSKGDPRIPHVPAELYKQTLTPDSNGANVPASLTTAKQCSICFEERKFPTVTPCGHIFCWSCVVRFCITNPSCPICRTPCEPQKLLCLFNYP